jgi:hypothetical protein
MMGAAVQAQGRDELTGPFTSYEAQTLSEVWPDIRKAAHFEDINWSTHGLSRAPGSREAQRVLSDNWDELRREEHFADIDWDDYSARSGRAERYGRAESGSVADEGGYHNSPYSHEDYEEMSRVWTQIRQAPHYEDINWRGVGLSSPPGDPDARRLTSRYWDELRKAAHFEDINWEVTTGYHAR